MNNKYVSVVTIDGEVYHGIQLSIDSQFKETPKDNQFSDLILQLHENKLIFLDKALIKSIKVHTNIYPHPATYC